MTPLLRFLFPLVLLAQFLGAQQAPTEPAPVIELCRYIWTDSGANEAYRWRVEKASGAYRGDFVHLVLQKEPTLYWEQVYLPPRDIEDLWPRILALRLQDIAKYQLPRQMQFETDTAYITLSPPNRAAMHFSVPFITARMMKYRAERTRINRRYVPDDVPPDLGVLLSLLWESRGIGENPKIIGAVPPRFSGNCFASQVQDRLNRVLSEIRQRARPQ